MNISNQYIAGFIELPSGIYKDSDKYNKRKDEIYTEMRKINKRGLAETK